MGSFEIEVVTTAMSDSSLQTEVEARFVKPNRASTCRLEYAKKTTLVWVQKCLVVYIDTDNCDALVHVSKEVVPD